MAIRFKKGLLAAGVAGFTGLAASVAGAAVVPFAQTFDAAPTGTALPADFVESGPAIPSGGAADYTIEADVPVGNNLQASLSAATAATGTTGVAANRSAAVAFPGLTSGGFSISSEFTLDAFTAGGTGSTLNFGLAARGSATDFSSGSNYRLLYTPYATNAAVTGRLSLSEFGGAGGLAGTLTSANAITPAAGLSGVLTLTGTESGGVLTLTGTLVSGATTLTVTGTDASILAGQNFGYRTALNAQLGSTETGPLTSSMNVDYDNFTAIPEPASAGLLGAVGLLLLGRRRRA